ncbi:MAG: hypothetical protein MR537_01385 [Clostridiales bacterium]|nr:hypothetical protein [Clostridiales bacterium]
MGEVREVFDVKQHPRKYGETTGLEERITAIEKRFSEIYEREFIEDYGINSWGFRTPQGTRFTVNGIYEWQTVFLEYDDGEDGDMIPITEFDEDRMFHELHEEILISERDEQRAKENAFRIYKTEQHDNGLLIRFRFWGEHERVEALYSHRNVLIDGMTYSYIRVDDSIQAVIIQEHLETDLYDHWIKFV